MKPHPVWGCTFKTELMYQTVQYRLGQLSSVNHFLLDFEDQQPLIPGQFAAPNSRLTKSPTQHLIMRCLVLTFHQSAPQNQQYSYLDNQPISPSLLWDLLDGLVARAFGASYKTRLSP